jgi:hypothetical protein
MVNISDEIMKRAGVRISAHPDEYVKQSIVECVNCGATNDVVDADFGPVDDVYNIASKAHHVGRCPNALARVL